MKLKARYEKESDVPAEHKALYVKQDDGSFVLDVEGMVDSSKLTELQTKVSEFRQNNLDLQKKIKEFDGKEHLTKEEADELRALKAERDKNKDKQMIEEGKIEELFAQRTQKMKETYDAQIKALTTARDENGQKYETTKNRLSTILVDNEVHKILGDVAVPLKGAQADIAARARQVWKVDDNGKVVAQNEKGEQIFGAKGEPLTLSEWATELVKTAPFLFEPSSGGGNRGTLKNQGQQHDGNVKRISRADENAKSMNIEAIAKGTAVLVE